MVIKENNIFELDYRYLGVEVFYNGCNNQFNKQIDKIINTIKKRV